MSIVIFESACPTWLITYSTSKRFASSAIEMYVRRRVRGVVSGNPGSPRAVSRSDASAAASPTISAARWRLIRDETVRGEEARLAAGRQDRDRRRHGGSVA